jgi:hypothetical protein
MARYYDSRTGTFCSADPLAGSPGDPQSWNRYPYGRNDPIDITDPSGKHWWNWLIDIGIGVAAGWALPEIFPSLFADADADALADDMADSLGGSTGGAVGGGAAGGGAAGTSLSEAEAFASDGMVPAAAGPGAGPAIFGGMVGAEFHQVTNQPKANKPPCSENTTYEVPKDLQAQALNSTGATMSNYTLTSAGKVAGFTISNFSQVSFQGLTLPFNSSMSVMTAPGGFTMGVSPPNYLGLPTPGGASVGVNFVRFANGAFTNVNGRWFGISGSSSLGRWMGINKNIRNALNSNPDAVNGGKSLSNALDNCTF